MLVIYPVAAQETIIVTASRTGPERSVTTGLDRAEVLRDQPVTALEPLDSLAGVRAFSKGGLSYLSIRGGEPNFTLVLLDGVRLNDPTNSRGGAFDFEQLDPFAIERIEVARSALSAVHGADALSGVVHLRLRSPEAGETFVSANSFADTEGAAALGATTGLGWSGGGLLASGGWFDSGGLFEGVELRRWQGLARFTEKAGGAEISALVLHGRADRRAFPEDSGGPRFAVVRDREERDTRLTLASVQIADPGESSFQPRLAASWSRQDSDIDTPPISAGVFPGVPRIVSDTRFDRIEAIADVRVSRSERLTIAAGASYIRERGESAGIVDVGFPLPSDFKIDRSSGGLFGELALELKLARFNAAIRYDNPSSERGVVTFRTGATLALDERTTLFADYAEGYKLPSLFALAFPITANPDLRPERSRTVTSGIEREVGRGRVRAALFESRFRNLVDFDVERFTHVNRGRVSSRGVELDAAIPIASDVKLQGALTYMDVNNEPGTPPLRSRPDWQGSLSVDWRANDRLGLSATGRFNSRYFDSSIPTGLIMQEGHVELNATASYRLSKTAMLQVTARNLTSEDYSNAVGFPAHPRTIRLGLLGNF